MVVWQGDPRRDEKLTKVFMEGARTSFPDINILHENTKKVLLLLETRSYNNNGDTKFYDDNIAKMIGISVRAVQRHMRKLEQLGFIIRATVKKYDRTRAVTAHREGFYSDRIVRCCRMFCIAKFKAADPRAMGWKKDHRPYISPANFDVDIKWIAPEPLKYKKEFSEIWIEVLPACNTPEEQIAAGLLSPEVPKYYDYYREMWEYGDPASKRLLGKYIEPLHETEYVQTEFLN